MSRFGSTTTRGILLLAIVVSVAFAAWAASSSATSIRNQQRELAAGVASSHIGEFIVAGRWVGEHEGVFVMSGTGVEPDPYLLDSDLCVSGVSMRVTALRPLDPGNRPDNWERGALESFDSADDHRYEVVERKGEPVFRYIAPLIADESCLGCHDGPGDQVGNVRGALSLTMPYAPFVRAGEDVIGAVWLRLGAFSALAVGLILGLGGILLATESRLRAANETLERANAVLEDQNAARTQFLATMSHELRTPLNSIIGFSGILTMGMAGGLSAEQRKQIGIINSAGKRLLVLINDILDLSKVEAGRIVLVAEEFAAAAVLDGVVDIVRPLTEEHGLELRVSTLGAEGTLYSDRRRIEQVLVNLVANAVKHTDSGYISLEVASRADDVEFVIEDTGIGIDAQNIESFFNEYHQVTPDTRHPKSHGLGLMISHKLAGLLGGEITIRSKPGCGSIFTFRVLRRLPDLPGPGEGQ